MVLSQEQKDQLERDGYLLIPDVFPEEQMDALKVAAERVVADFDASEVTVFTTGEDQVQTTTDYFMTSGGKVRCFFETGALNADGSLRVPRELAVNKFGHAMHDLIPEFERFSYQKKIKELCEDLGLNDALSIQSMYIFKQPGIGGEVVPHQDGTFLLSDPPTVYGMWIAVEDATVENGCLRARPGSHKVGVQRKFLRNEDGTAMVFDKPVPEEWNMQDMVALPVKRGGLILLHGAVLHGSYANQSGKSRHAYTLHMMDKDSKWDEKNWLQRPLMPFRHMSEVESDL